MLVDERTVVRRGFGSAARYIKFHKPFEVLCQFTDTQGRKTLKDYVPIPGVYPAGRLDYRSEGLLLLMDDGPLIHHLTDPLYQHTRTYLVQVEGVVTVEVLQTLQSKIVLPGIQTRPAQAEIIPEPDLPARSKPVRDYHPTTWLRIVISEGKKHQVRRMTAAVGLPTLRLVRVAIGPITLGNLQAGEWSDLTADEIQRLKFAVKSPYGKRS